MVLVLLCFMYSLSAAQHTHHVHPAVRINVYPVDELYDRTPTPRPATPAPPYEAPAPVVPEALVPIADNTRIKLALIGLAISALSTTATALIMWGSRGC